jgi:hypothetical protein
MAALIFRMGTGTGVRLQVHRPLSCRHLQTEDAERRHRTSKSSRRSKCRREQHHRQGNYEIK